ncbi:MAG: hypothetical protein SVU32_02715 [Candidatus Nanohaloarchaea archaeon]|nr:hypothetical protein [Candidatus Nanohaloarchaea archaeon]
MDREKLGRALLEYCGIPLAVFMTAGIVANYATGFGFQTALINPLRNYLGFYVVNFWLVIGIYVYRQKYRQDLVLDARYEIGMALLIALAWVVVQPLLLLAGYGFYLWAAMRKEQMETFIHSSLLPEMPTEAEEAQEAEEFV